MENNLVKLVKEGRLEKVIEILDLVQHEIEVMWGEGITEIQLFEEIEGGIVEGDKYNEPS